MFKDEKNCFKSLTLLNYSSVFLESLRRQQVHP